MAIPKLSVHDDMILVEIVPRLPVKSLLKFRSVSKSWHSLISSNQFIKTHLSKQVHQRILLNYYSKLEHCNLQSMFTNDHPLFDAIDTSYLFDSSKTYVTVVGSCDGLILLQFQKDFILWNPSTRKFKKLPPFLATPILSASGLGFDKHSDDYRAVVYYEVPGMLGGLTVYSLRTREWTRVGKKFTSKAFAYLVFGKLHWVAKKISEAWKIMSFDLETEEYGVLKFPDYDLENILNIQLCVSQGCLYLISYKVTHTDVWIVQGYKLGKETFTKLATLPLKNDFRTCFHAGQFMYVEKKGEILLRFDHKFVVFNTNDCKFKNLDITLPLPGGLEKVLTYVESFVSPFV